MSARFILTTKMFPKRMNRFFSFKFIEKIPGHLRILILVVVVGVGIGAVLISRNTTSDFSENVAVTSDDVIELIAKIGQHYRVPEETPVVAEIKDINLLLSESSFYQGAQNGDYLFVFPVAQKALIYSLERDILVNVGPVQFDNSGAPEGSVNRAITIDIRNGSGVSGIAGKLGDSLDDNIQYSVIAIDDAANDDYPQTIIVNRTGSSIANLVADVAQIAGGVVVDSLPLDEAKSVADIVIILGKN